MIRYGAYKVLALYFVILLAIDRYENSMVSFHFYAIVNTAAGVLNLLSVHDNFHPNIPGMSPEIYLDWITSITCLPPE